MLRIIDEERSIDMTAKYQLGQEVVITGYQGYHKGKVVGLAGMSNDKGTVFMYTIELYAGRKSAPKVKKCPENRVYPNVHDALIALADIEKKRDEEEAENAKTLKKVHASKKAAKPAGKPAPAEEAPVQKAEPAQENVESSEGKK